MKKIILIIVLLNFSFLTHAQILKKIGDRIKNRAETKTNEKVDTKVDQTVDSAFSKTEKGINNAVKGNSDDNNNTTGSNETPNNDNAQVKPGSIKAYSKYDFVPGEKIIVFEDFMQDAIGDFPAKWNTNSSGEIVTVEGKQGRWLKMTKGVYMPDFIDSLPQDFTLEFDVLVNARAHSWGIDPVLAELSNRDDPPHWDQSKNYLNVNLLPQAEGGGQSFYYREKAGNGEASPTVKTNCFTDITRPVHVAMWRQKERLRIYMNEDKVFDIPKAFDPQAKLNAFLFSLISVGEWNFFASNLRLAVGAPDTRKKILEQNKWVTHGILFDVNSDNIKSESYGTLKEMANVLKEYGDLKVKIVGHTDADGKDADNLDLSKRRAAAVKVALSKEFGIDESRMETDGKGESEPIDKNDTPAGKANNRRVEFIKI
jgi:outer membrane protein OmpA-like peptidoglycan-associated protein